MFDMKPAASETYHVEAVLSNYLLRGDFQPLGAFLVYLNDETRTYIRFDEAELLPLAPDRQMRGVRRDMVSVNKQECYFIGVLDAESAQSIQVLQSSRPVVFYLGRFAVQGKLHVNVDAPEADLLAGTRNFFAVSEAMVYPLRPGAATPTRRIPLLFLNRLAVQAYHLHKPSADT